MKNEDKNSEHPLFPSGEWEGFYTYYMEPNASQHKMQFFLDFENGAITGGGSDDVGGFTWRGIYDTKAMNCKMLKRYATHTVEYQGRADENGIWGTWSIEPFSRGGFHIWIKTNGEENEEEAVKEAEVVKIEVRKRKI